MWYFLAGLANGVVFGPPSELVIIAAFALEDSPVVPLLQFIAGNTIGHIFLFWLTRSNFPFIIKLICQVEAIFTSNQYTERLINRSMQWLKEPSGWYLVYGRLLPFFHTFTSIVAATDNRGTLAVFFGALLGNFLFVAVLGFNYFVISAVVGKTVGALVVFLMVAALHYFLKRKIRSRD